jgi:hypothetical protein
MEAEAEGRRLVLLPIAGSSSDDMNMSRTCLRCGRKDGKVGDFICTWSIPIPWNHTLSFERFKREDYCVCFLEHGTISLFLKRHLLDIVKESFRVNQ